MLYNYRVQRRCRQYIASAKCPNEAPTVGTELDNHDVSRSVSSSIEGKITAEVSTLTRLE